MRAEYRAVFQTSRYSDQRGFTLIEVLSVTTIIGILAAIGFPVFAGQRAKAQDTEAIVHAKTAVTTLEALRVTKGTYNVAVADLVAEEPSLREASNFEITGDEGSFSLNVDSDGGPNAGGTFTLARSSGGVYTRTCSHPGKGRCSADGDW